MTKPLPSAEFADIKANSSWEKTHKSTVIKYHFSFIFKMITVGSNLTNSKKIAKSEDADKMYMWHHGHAHIELKVPKCYGLPGITFSTCPPEVEAGRSPSSRSACSTLQILRHPGLQRKPNPRKTKAVKKIRKKSLRVWRNSFYTTEEKSGSINT